MSAHVVDTHPPHPSKTGRGASCWYYSDAYTWKPGYFTEFIPGDEPRVPVVDAATGVIVILSFRSLSFSPIVPKEAPAKPRVGGGGS